MSASLPPATFRNLTTILRCPVGMTWEAIVADRQRRGLEVSPADPQRKVATMPPPKRRAAHGVKATKGPRMVDGADARLPSNLSPCTAPAATEKPRSAAGAASMRRKAMSACSCRLCNLALFPAMTFAEHAAFVGALQDVARQANVYGYERSSLDRKLDAERRAALP